MTRINCVPVWELSDSHLVAEYREMLRYRHAHNRDVDVTELPKTYRLGTGHVKFFYDKGAWLLARHVQLRYEMIARGMKPTLELDLSGWPPHCFKFWSPTRADIQLNRQRIFERMASSKRPHFTTFHDPEAELLADEHEQASFTANDIFLAQKEQEALAQ